VAGSFPQEGQSGARLEGYHSEGYRSELQASRKPAKRTYSALAAERNAQRSGIGKPGRPFADRRTWTAVRDVRHQHRWGETAG